jgi:hypothetical protein
MHRILRKIAEDHVGQIGNAPTVVGIHVLEELVNVKQSGEDKNARLV